MASSALAVSSSAALSGWAPSRTGRRRPAPPSAPQWRPGRSAAVRPCGSGQARPWHGDRDERQTSTQQRERHTGGGRGAGHRRPRRRAPGSRARRGTVSGSPRVPPSLARLPGLPTLPGAVMPTPRRAARRQGRVVGRGRRRGEDRYTATASASSASSPAGPRPAPAERRRRPAGERHRGDEQAGQADADQCARRRGGQADHELFQAQLAGPGAAAHAERGQQGVLQARARSPRPPRRRRTRWPPAAPRPPRSTTSASSGTFGSGSPSSAACARSQAHRAGAGPAGQAGRRAPCAATSRSPATAAAPVRPARPAASAGR